MNPALITALAIGVILVAQVVRQVAREARRQRYVSPVWITTGRRRRR